MRPEPSHRKLVKHYEHPGHVRELTFSCYRRTALLTNDGWREMLSRAIDAAMERHAWRLAAFVFMPEHVHLLCFPLGQASGVDKLLMAIKRPFSFRIKLVLHQNQSPLLDKLTIQQRPGISTFRYWQEGPGYDRNLDQLKSVEAAIEYIHQNPVRRKLYSHTLVWKWSSARWHHDLIQDQVLPKLTPLPPHFFL
jgi:putative transposase